MSPPINIIEKNYSNGKPFTDVRIAVINRENLRQITIQKKVRIDTGFDAGVHVRESEMLELSTIGIRPTPGSATLAGDVTAKAYFCFAYLQQIGDFELPPPGMEVTLMFQGSGREGLLGLEILNNWIVTFNGPEQFFKIVHPEA
jgi:hypothetical protein